MRKFILQLSVLVILSGCGAELAMITPNDNDFDLQHIENHATADGWWKPAVGLSWQIQLNGRLSTSYKVQAYDIDLFDTPAATIANLHAQGVKVICYFSAGSYEDWRPDASQFPDEVIGASNGWAGENWLDIRQIDALKPIMEARIKLAKLKGCDAVDADNVDSFTNTSGFDISYDEQLAYNVMLADLAHANNLAIGLKNDLLQIVDLADDFDFAINEQCLQYQECHYLAPFVAAGKPVLHIEYSGRFNSICAQTKSLGFSTVKKNYDLKAAVKACPK